MIDIEGVKSEMYFAPTYVGIKTKKTVKIKNLSPINILVKINIDKMVNGLIEVEENNFEMDTNLVKNINFSMKKFRHMLLSQRSEYIIPRWRI